MYKYYATNIFNRSLSSHTSASISQAKSESHEIDSDERPLTFLKYNRDDDLLFSYAKDHNLTVWFADNDEHLSTYRGHNDAVWCCDVSSKSSQSTNKLTLLPFFYDKIFLNFFDLVSTRDSMMLIIGSLDQTAKIWNVQIGEQLYSFKARRFVEFDWT